MVLGSGNLLRRERLPAALMAPTAQKMSFLMGQASIGVIEKLSTYP
jgi:hypothetical protein